MGENGYHVELAEIGRELSGLGRRLARLASPPAPKAELTPEQKEQRAQERAQEQLARERKKERQKEAARRRGGVPYPPLTLEGYRDHLRSMLDALSRMGGDRQIPTRRAVRDALRWYVEVQEVSIWQNEPDTAVSAKIGVYDVPFYQLHFSGARWPDTYSSDRGIAIAIGKCVCGAVKEAMDQVHYTAYVARLRNALSAEIALAEDASTHMVSVPADVANPYRPVILCGPVESGRSQTGEVRELIEA